MRGILDHLNTLVFDEAMEDIQALIKPLDQALSRLPRKKKLRIEPDPAISIRFKEGYFYAIDMPSGPKPPYTPFMGYFFNKRNAYVLIPVNFLNVKSVHFDLGKIVSIYLEDGWRISVKAIPLRRDNVYTYVKVIPHLLAEAQKMIMTYKKAVKNANSSLSGLKSVYENLKNLVEERLNARGMKSLVVHAGDQALPKASIFWIIVTPASIKKVSPNLKGVAHVVTKVLSDRVETRINSMSYGSSYLLFNLGLLKGRGKKLPTTIEGIKDIRREDKELYVITWDSVDSAEKNLEKLVKALLV